MTWLLRPDYLLLLALGTLCSALLAGWTLMRGKGPIGSGRLILSAALVAGLSAFQLVLAALLGGGAFAFLMVAWIDLAVVVPACGALVIFLGYRRATRLTRWTALLGLTFLPLGLWASLVEPNRLVVERPQLLLSPEKDGQEDIRIAVLADLQTSRVRGHERRAVQALLAEDPDVILIPGDLFQGWMYQWDEGKQGLHELLSTLEAPGGVYLVSGNAGNRRGLPELIEGTGVQLLVNRPVEVDCKGRRLVILGLEDSGFPRRVVSDLEERAHADPGAIHIILVHRPGAGVRALSPMSPVDLVIAGHTHGGQVVVPGLGPPLTLSRVPREVAAGGMHELDGNSVYVSRGVGMERKWAPRVRFFCPPEITILTLAGGQATTPPTTQR